MKTILHDETFSETGYDCQGNKIAETDPAGITTTFEYDEFSRLEAVIDALGAVTRYSYDEVGSKLTQTDPNGNTTTWAYDDLGRVSKHTLPLGQAEYFKYDPNGSVTEKTDFNGDTTVFEYTACCNRLERKVFADGAEVSYTYTPVGNRETVTDSRGVTR